MAQRTKFDPDTVYHFQVPEGGRVIFDNIAYGHRATLQVPGRRAGEVLDQGAARVDPAAVPDAASRVETGEARQPGTAS